jgi:hypothetical protein
MGATVRKASSMMADLLGGGADAGHQDRIVAGTLDRVAF